MSRVSVGAGSTGTSTVFPDANVTLATVFPDGKVTVIVPVPVLAGAELVERGFVGFRGLVSRSARV